jgi:hypothetical protein
MRRLLLPWLRELSDFDLAASLSTGIEHGFATARIWFGVEKSGPLTTVNFGVFTACSACCCRGAERAHQEAQACCTASSAASTTPH